ncbi:MAG: choice-of-anchor J domain-containing protein [Muribaculaceae bacterium]
MKKTLLISTLAACSALTISAQAPAQIATMRAVSPQHAVQVPLRTDAHVLSTRALAPGVQLQVVDGLNGMPVKRLVTNRLQQAINPRRNAPAKVEAVDGISLQEGFEAFDGTDGWQPEGWEAQSLGDPIESDVPQGWFISAGLMYSPLPVGNYYEAIFFDAAAKDEWLITPTVTLTATPVLYFQAYIDPIFLFNLNNVDWDNFEFTAVEPAANVQVLVKPAGINDWTILHDFFDDYKDLTLSELWNVTYDQENLTQYSIDLADYASQEVQIAFRYVGTDGNTVMLDEVMVSNPQLDAEYAYPFNSLYFGINTDYSAISLSMPLLPVNEELTWMNYCEEDGVTSTWQYHDWATNEILTTNSFDLSATYFPDYSSDFTCRNNCYNSPILTLSKPGAADGSYQRFQYFQAGGRAEWSSQGELVTYGVMPFDYLTEGFDIFVADNDMEAGIPIYGYSKDVDQFWTDYTFQGQEEEGEGVKLTAIMNCYLPSQNPIVFSDAWVLAKGQIGADAVFTLDVCLIDDEGALKEPMAVATCRGADMIMSEGGMQNYYAIPFTFDQPVVISAADTELYVVRLSGFNDPDNVSYFAPYQSVEDNPDWLGLGWLQKEISMGGETRTSLSSTGYYTGFQSFAIGLDAFYPWLFPAADEVSTDSEGLAQIALGSYYDGSQLTATQPDGSPLPAWLTATITGRYGDAKIEFTATGTEAADQPVLISAPGVAATVTVHYDGNASIASAIADGDNAPAQLFNLAGQQVSGTPAPGIYFQRSTNGTVTKQLVK